MRKTPSAQHPANSWYELDYGVAANFVMSADGRFADELGSSRGISNARDLQHLIHLRRQCDALVTDGKTARLERYEAKVGRETYVFTRRKPANGLRALHASSPEDFDELFGKLKTLHRRILLETGPTILRTLIQRGLVDRLFLSITGNKDERDSGLRAAQTLLGIGKPPSRNTHETELDLFRFDFR